MRKIIYFLALIITSSLVANAFPPNGTRIIFGKSSYYKDKNHTLHTNYKYKDDEKIYKSQLPLINLEEEKLFDFELRYHEMPVVEYIESYIRTGPVNTNEGIHKYSDKTYVNKKISDFEVYITFMKNGDFTLFAGKRRKIKF